MRKLAWYKGYFDGSCNPNPGIMGIGVVLYSPEGKLVNSCSYGGEDGTSNMAEFIALSILLNMAVRAGVEHLQAHGDSELVLKQAAGIWKSKTPRLAVVLETIHNRAKQLKHVEYVSIPRLENAEADNLSTEWKMLGNKMPYFPRKAVIPAKESAVCGYTTEDYSLLMQCSR